MEELITDLILSEKVPKVIRDIIVIVACSFIAIIGIICVLNSAGVAGKIFGVAIAAVAVFAGAYLVIVKIHKLK